TASFWILTIPALWYAGRPIHFGIGPVFAAVWKYIVASLLAGWACPAIFRALPSFVGLPGAAGALVRIMTTSLLFVVLYLAAVILLHRGYSPLYQVARLLADMGLWGRLSTLSPAFSAIGSTGSSAALVSTPEETSVS